MAQYAVLYGIGTSTTNIQHQFYSIGKNSRQELQMFGFVNLYEELRVLQEV